jgi:hypothetical protein
MDHHSNNSKMNVTDSLIYLQHVDILIVGGGLSGLMAAMAAKEKHNGVLIVEPSNVLGGQGTAGGVAGFCGDTKRVNFIFEELVARLAEHNLIADYNPNNDRREYDLEWCAFFLQEMVTSRNIHVLLHSRVIDADAENGHVKSVRISTAGKSFKCQPKFVIDSSGINVIAESAGFPVINEGANKQLPMSLYFTMWDTGKKTTPILPASCPQWAHEDDIPMTSLHFFPTGKVEVKMKVVGFDAADGVALSQAEIFARRQMMGLIYFLQTKGYKGNVLDRHVLASVSRAIGVREQNRIVGEHVLTYDEIKRGCVFKDAVAVGTYHTDYHWPDTVQRAGTGIIEMLGPYQIPLRSLIPKGATNVLMPGRGVSADQMALSSLRVMATVSQMGFAAGKAAKLAVEKKVPIKDLEIKELQQEIEAGGQSLNLSYYGEYQSDLLFFHDDVYEGDERSTFFSPSIIQQKNNRFRVTWKVKYSDGKEEIWLAERYQGKWSQTSPVESELIQENFKKDNDESTILHDDTRVKIELTTNDKPILIVSISKDNGKTWIHNTILNSEDSTITDYAFVTTPTGLAIIYILNNRRIIFWHGSIGRILSDKNSDTLLDKLHSGIS